MMHVDIPLRRRPSFCAPKGPSFRWARSIKTDIVGTKIEFRAPKHSPTRRLKGKPFLPEKQYIARGKYHTPNTVSFTSNFSPEFTVADLWEYMALFKHEWAFYGPWFTGYLANLEMYFNILQLKQPETKQRNDSPSFFHPRVFEKVVGDYLTNRYAVHQDEGQAEWIAPVNWQPLTSLPTVAVRLQVRRDEQVTTSGYQEFIFFPISDSQLGYILFCPRQNAPGSKTQAEKDAMISRENVIALMDNIINSLKVELSPEAAAAQAKALEGLDDTSLIKTFAPMQWSTGSKTNHSEPLKSLG